MTNQRKAIIFTAVSSQEQAKKVSLKDQELDGYAAAKRLDASVIKVLSVKGFSRSESDIELFLEEMAEIEEYAFHELRDLWRANRRNQAKGLPPAFDLLIVREHSRLGRSNSLHAWVIENVLKSGAQVYLTLNAKLLTTPAESRIDIAFGGYESTTEIDKNVARMQKGIDDVVKKGLPSTVTPFPFRVVRNELGERLKIEVDPKWQPLIDSIYHLLVSGVEYHGWETDLAAQGFIHPKTGKAYHPGYFFQVIRTPYWWGHSARFYNNKQVSDWIFAPSKSLPEGVVIHYNTHQAVWNEEQSHAARAEMQRRSDAKGKAKPHQPHLFTGLIKCDVCHCTVRYIGRYGLQYWACGRHYRNYSHLPECDQLKSIRQERVIQYLTTLFEQLLSSQNIEAAWDALQNKPDQASINVENIQLQLETLKAEIRQLIAAQISAPANTRQIYTDMIDEKSRLIETLENQYLTAQHKLTLEKERSDEFSKGMAQLKEIGLERFWSLPTIEIHQCLFRIFGKARLSLRDGNIAGLIFP